jgi:glycosyltransferase involved in cell wall biosynthesis
MITLIGTFYNQGQYVDGWMDSIFNQTKRPDRVVISNDASTDNTAAKLDSWLYAFEYAGISATIITQSKNVGFLMSIKTLFEEGLITGDYISILEGDDLYLEDKIAKSWRYLRDNPQFEAVHTDTWHLTDGESISPSRVGFWKQHGRHGDAKHPGHFPDIPEGFVYDELIKNNFIMTCTFMGTPKAWSYYKYDLFKERNYAMGDYPWFLGLSRENQIGYINEPLSYYRAGSGISNNPLNRAKMVADTERVKDDARAGRL